MGISVVKANTYRLIDTNSFELPLPFRFSIYKKDYHIADYEITEDEQIVCTIVTKFKEDMLTTLRRPLTISDIHYLFSCRVFQDHTPYTYQMLKNVGLEKYNVRDILMKTHGVIPYDKYWLKFEGEDELDYETVQEQFDSMMEAPLVPPESAAPAADQPAISPDLSEILSQHTIDISGLVGQAPQVPAPQDAENMLRTAIAFSHPEEGEQELVNNKMSEDEITALLMSAGIETPVMTDEQIDEVFAVNSNTEESGGGMMSQDAIEAMLASGSVNDVLESGGGKMSQDAIEALLAANAAAEPAPEPEPAATSGGMMSQDAIEALLAANAAAAEPAPEPAPAEPSGGKMSQDAIEALLAANAAAAEPAPEPEPAPAEPSGGKMSQDAIEALLAANAAAAEPAPEPAPAPAEPSGGKMSQDAIEALLAANAAAAEPAPEPEPAPAAPSGGKMSQDAIEALLAANAAAAEPAPEPAPAPAEPSGGKMSQDAIEALLAANAAAAEPAPEPDPAPAETTSGGKMSQDAIEALLNSMQDEANK